MFFFICVVIKNPFKNVFFQKKFFFNFSKKKIFRKKMFKKLFQKKTTKLSEQIMWVDLNRLSLELVK